MQIHSADRATHVQSASEDTRPLHMQIWLHIIQCFAIFVSTLCIFGNLVGTVKVITPQNTHHVINVCCF